MGQTYKPQNQRVGAQAQFMHLYVKIYRLYFYYPFLKVI